MVRASAIDRQLRELAIDALSTPQRSAAPTDAALSRLVELGTELWLDTGNLEEASSLWHAEFTALTTNNTLANQVVQTGALDDVARKAAAEIRAAHPGISEQDLVMEMGFVVNCHLALRLVRAFDARVSVELHPSVAHDVERTVEYAHRYHAVCPERFTIKIPLTPEGYCAVARVCPNGIPVNYTLGFSARQNYLAAIVSKPTYVNVFLGRLNAVVSDNGIGDGRGVGEKATMATQMALLDLRRAQRTDSRLICASMRAASQVSDLAGCDVYTMPPKVARDFLASRPDPTGLVSQIGRRFDAPDDTGILADLWSIDEAVQALADELARRGGATLTGEDVREADCDHSARLFCRFTAAELDEIRSQGKIPRLERWKDAGVALDDLMTQAALQSFAVDQAALDDRLRKLAASA